jgi:transposase-like protein
MCYNAPIDLIAEVCEITHKTAFEWRHRVFATVDGCRTGSC